MRKFYKRYKKKIRRLTGTSKDQYVLLTAQIVVLEEELNKEKKILKDTKSKDIVRLVIIQNQIKMRMNRIRLILEDKE